MIDSVLCVFFIWCGTGFYTCGGSFVNGTPLCLLPPTHCRPSDVLLSFRSDAGTSARIWNTCIQTLIKRRHPNMNYAFDWVMPELGRLNLQKCKTDPQRDFIRNLDPVRFLSLSICKFGIVRYLVWVPG